MPRKCFVAMPFDPSFDGVWRSLIRPTVTACGDVCVRGDENRAPGVILDQVVAALRDADYVIADLTGRNANVYYELGFAHALGVPTILLTQDEGEAPFNVRHVRLHRYRNTIAGAAALTEELRAAITATPARTRPE